MNLQEVIDSLEADPKTQAVVAVLTPFLGAMKREGQEFANDLIQQLLIADFASVNELAWSKMTEEERDAYSDVVLKEAMAEVDRQFELQKMAKEMAFKVASSLLTMLL